MKKIYSKVEPSILLHIVTSVNEIKSGRLDVVPEKEYIQLAILKMNKGKTFLPHKHIIKKKVTDIAQESWVVFQGKVKCIFYDLDDSIIDEPILEQGSISITLRGAHNYLILEDNTTVLEYKTGPYLGQKFDKQFINK
jgi:cupin fold WbuC family metalloprotein